MLDLKLKMLIVEDESYFRKKLNLHLSKYGSLIEADNFEDAKNHLLAGHFDLAIIDIKLNKKDDGFELLKITKQYNIFSIILTNYNFQQFIQKAYNLGCEHYFTKDQFSVVIEPIVRERMRKLSGDYFDSCFKNEFITQNEKLKSEIQSIQYSVLRSPVLIQGETGVGKGVLAGLIHKLSFGEEAPFISINASAISEHLIESEFFGHVKGSFTGASEDKIGKIEQANGGILFLDEIGNMSSGMQEKLLKVIEEKTFYPVGSNEQKKSDFQLITATCENIYDKVQTGGFRADLIFRINTISLKIPPLRERRDDIPLLVEEFLNQSPRKVHIGNEAMSYLKKYHWGGNVRELKSVVDILTMKSNGIVEAIDLPEYILKNKNTFSKNKVVFLPEEHHTFIQNHGLKKYVTQVEAEALKRAYDVHNKQVSKVEKYLKISHSTYYRLLERTRDVLKTIGYSK